MLQPLLTLRVADYKTTSTQTVFVPLVMSALMNSKVPYSRGFECCTLNPDLQSKPTLPLFLSFGLSWWYRMYPFGVMFPQYPFGVMFPQPTASLDVSHVSVSAMMSRSLSDTKSTKSPPCCRWTWCCTDKSSPFQKEHRWSMMLGWLSCSSLLSTVHFIIHNYSDCYQPDHNQSVEEAIKWLMKCTIGSLIAAVSAKA